ncbi:MAG: protealysin inhibitor emfourin [Betaproteobacteria bacterium]
MRITFSMSGGIAHFPGLSRPISIDLDASSAHAIGNLRELLREVDFFSLPAHCGGAQQVAGKTGAAAPAAADHRTYTITLEAERQTHTVQVSDPVGDERLQRLIALLREASRPV